MTFLLGCGTPACFHDRSIGGRWVAAYRRTFPGPSVRITCLDGHASAIHELVTAFRAGLAAADAGVAVVAAADELVRGSLEAAERCQGRDSEVIAAFQAVEPLARQVAPETIQEVPDDVVG